MDDKPAGSGTGRQAGELAEAIAVARSLLQHISIDVASGGSEQDAAVLRETGEVLARLAPPPVERLVQAPAEAAVAPEHRIVLDVTDLLGYLQNNRLPTGIQRVQSELIFNIIKAEAGRGGRLCCFDEARGQWVEVDAARFMELCIQSRVRGGPQDPRWRVFVRDMNESIAANPAMRFPEGAVLVNGGTSWWLPNYFIYVRQAKAESNIRYIPLIHDLIPILTPEYCDPELVREFIDWFIGVLDHADFFLTVSEATKRDVVATAAKLGRPIPEDRVAVMPLNADFRAAETQAIPTTRRFDEPFVLFVSTIEARKNQLGALDAWTRLITKHGPRKVPRLVLVGKRGFQSDIVLRRLDMNADLRDRVTILSDIEDADLQALYRDCLFTLYPSFYEGWGLPVTESLAYGKVPLVADNSSLLESGGKWAVQVKTGSAADLLAGLERLIFDDGFRKAREAAIAEDFRPRSWADVAAGAAERIEGWAATPAAEWHAPEAHDSCYYPLSRVRASRIRPGLGSAETFRVGLGWYAADEAGCWVRPSGAELELVVADPDAIRIGFELMCPEDTALRYQVAQVGSGASISGEMEGGQRTWAFLDLPKDEPEGSLRFRFTAAVTRTPENWTEKLRRPGLGIKGFYLLADRPSARIEFVEAAALGALSDRSFYRERG